MGFFNLPAYKAPQSKRKAAVAWNKTSTKMDLLFYFQFSVNKTFWGHSPFSFLGLKIF